MATPTFEGNPLKIGQVITIGGIEYKVAKIDDATVTFDVSIIIRKGNPIMLIREFSKSHSFHVQVTVELCGQLLNSEYQVGALYLPSNLKYGAIHFGTLSTITNFS